MINQNRMFLLVTGGFNARNSSWWKNDYVTREGNEIESPTCSYGLSQLTSDPTHILQNAKKPLYERLVWDYKNSDSQSINKAIEMFNWEKLFQNKNIHDHLKLFNETIVNIASDYIPNKFIICNDKDPPW